jgi:hypothetical protein
VSEQLLDELGMDALPQEQRGADVAEVVKADLGQPRPFEERRERPRSEVGGVVDRASLRAEDQPLVPLGVARPPDLLDLSG